VLIRWFFRFCLIALISVRASAAEPMPTAGPGATKDEVIKIHGRPTRQSKLGDREFLFYPKGQLMLDHGKVERVDFSAGLPAPKPAPHAPSPTTPSTAKIDTPVDPWVQRFVDATREATARKARILALFTGSDWSPASRQFQDEVASHPDFINTFGADCVFLRLDFPMRTPITDDLRQQNRQLRERYGVTVYPTLLVLTAAGEKLATVDFAKLPTGASYRDRVITAVRLADSTIGTKVAPGTVEPSPPAPAVMPTTSVEVSTILTRARLLVIGGLSAGTVLAIVIYWLVWRKRIKPAPPVATIAERISEAASGVPSPAEIRAWSKARLRAIASGLAETEGYTVEPAIGGDSDLVLKRPGENKPCMLVCCVPASEGIVHAKQLRELVGTLTAEGVPSGWFISTMGFGFDARVYAGEQNLLLMDEERLLAKLRDLPPLLLSRVLLQATA
jgi:protein disulfide-isomerase